MGADMAKRPAIGVKPKKKSNLRNEKGMALLETIPILVVFIVLLAYGLGFFGVVHTGILNSIASRAYAFETFRNRTNLVYFRDRGSAGEYSHFAKKEVRFHGVNSEQKSFTEEGQWATTRTIAMGREQPLASTNDLDHNQKIIYNGETRFRKGTAEASPAWIMVGYGICINASCGE